MTTATCSICAQPATPADALQGVRSDEVMHMTCLSPDLQALLTPKPQLCDRCGTDLKWHLRDPRGPGCPRRS